MDGCGLMKKRAVMSLSGGMDSTGLLLYLLSEGYFVHAISFDYGQKHKIEIQKAKNNIEYLSENGINIKHDIVDLSSISSLLYSSLTDITKKIPEGHYEEEQMKSTVVPNRNAIFSSIVYASALSNAKKFDSNVIIALGVHSGDHAIYPDCRPDFYESLGDSFSIGNWDSEKVSFHLPYLKFDKSYILKQSVKSCEKLGLDFDKIFSNTLTSYNPDSLGRSSGKSGADVERILAFHSIGRKDPIEYVKEWEDVLNDALKIEKKYIEGLK
ncbi:MAG: 7-cyano-7-deazaguanine synthase [Methanobacteriota archaeon]|nr:MAG: 7-cyano-7-deazaguanine synthase [Euryarchaeota archaeon]